MKWITRARPKTDRIACPWLITKFIDPAAEILYVPADQVLDEAQRQDAISFDAPGARYTHRDGKCTFEVLIDDYHLDSDPALIRLAQYGMRSLSWAEKSIELESASADTSGVTRPTVSARNVYALRISRQLSTRPAVWMTDSMPE